MTTENNVLNGGFRERLETEISADRLDESPRAYCMRALLAFVTTEMHKHAFPPEKFSASVFFLLRRARHDDTIPASLTGRLVRPDRTL